MDLGVEYIFDNLGADHVSLIEDRALGPRRSQASRDNYLPADIVAVHVAGGYALATGKGQAVSCMSKLTRAKTGEWCR